MASRKDPKGRVLNKGEFYRSKENRYQFTYSDVVGQRHYIYAKTLSELREKEKEYHIADWSGTQNYGNNASLNYMYDRFMATKFGLKDSTYASYLQMYNRYVREEFGVRPVKNIHYSDVIGFYSYLLKHRKISIRTVEYVHKQISPALELAVQDGIIMRNPSKGAYGNFKKASGLSSRKIHALKIEEQRLFLDFIEDHPTWGRYYTIFHVMLGTGLRVGELVGLRWEDVDFENRCISVNHGIVNVKAVRGGKKEHLKVTLPKTLAGIRTVPIMEPVIESFKKEYMYSEIRGFPNCSIDGYTDFIFTKQNGTVYTSSRLDKALRDIIESYNKQEIMVSMLEDREPNLLPHISNHTLRHTFCTRLCERDVNIKVIQTIMGHASIKITMDIYAEVSKEKQLYEMDKLAKELDVF